MPSMTGYEFGNTEPVPFPCAEVTAGSGVVMKAAQAHLTGKRADGKALSDLVRARLA